MGITRTMPQYDAFLTRNVKFVSFAPTLHLTAALFRVTRNANTAEGNELSNAGLLTFEYFIAFADFSILIRENRLPGHFAELQRTRRNHANSAQMKEHNQTKTSSQREGHKPPPVPEISRNRTRFPAAQQTFSPPAKQSGGGGEPAIPHVASRHGSKRAKGKGKQTLHFIFL